MGIKDKLGKANMEDKARKTLKAPRINKKDVESSGKIQSKDTTEKGQ